jgi:hypothetical protein
MPLGSVSLERVTYAPCQVDSMRPDRIDFVNTLGRAPRRKRAVGASGRNRVYCLGLSRRAVDLTPRAFGKADTICPPYAG